MKRGKAIPSYILILAKLRPVIPEGVYTVALKPHPTDGHSALSIMTRGKAKEFSADPDIEIQLHIYGYARATKGYMAMAAVPAAEMALEKAGVAIGDVKTIKTHNPFAANAIYMADQMGVDVNGFNNHGSSLIFGHPRAPMAGRLIIEIIEESPWPAAAASSSAAAAPATLTPRWF